MTTVPEILTQLGAALPPGLLPDDVVTDVAKAVHSGDYSLVQAQAMLCDMAGVPPPTVAVKPSPSRPSPARPAQRHDAPDGDGFTGVGPAQSAQPVPQHETRRELQGHTEGDIKGWLSGVGGGGGEEGGGSARVGGGLSTRSAQYRVEDDPASPTAAMARALRCKEEEQRHLERLAEAWCNYDDSAVAKPLAPALRSAPSVPLSRPSALPAPAPTPASTQPSTTAPAQSTHTFRPPPSAPQETAPADDGYGATREWAPHEAPAAAPVAEVLLYYSNHGAGVAAIQWHLRTHNVRYHLVDCTEQPEAIAKARECAGGYDAPLPLVFVGQRIVGGAPAIAELVRKGTLMDLLRRYGYDDDAPAGEAAPSPPVPVPPAPAPEPAVGESVVLFRTSITGCRQTRDGCRAFEQQLYLHRVRYQDMDVSDNPFLRKQLVQRCGGTDRGLPLLFVGDRFACDAQELQELVDMERFLPLLEGLGYAHVPVDLELAVACGTTAVHVLEAVLADTA